MGHRRGNLPRLDRRRSRPGVNEAVCALSLSQTASYFKSEYDALEMTTAEIEEGINKMVRHFYYGP